MDVTAPVLAKVGDFGTHALCFDLRFGPAAVHISRSLLAGLARHVNPKLYEALRTWQW
jgi:hypothetical protein